MQTEPEEQNHPKCRTVYLEVIFTHLFAFQLDTVLGRGKTGKFSLSLSGSKMVD